MIIVSQKLNLEMQLKTFNVAFNYILSNIFQERNIKIVIVDARFLRRIKQDSALHKIILLSKFIKEFNYIK